MHNDEAIELKNLSDYRKLLEGIYMHFSTKQWLKLPSQQKCCINPLVPGVRSGGHSE